MYKIGLRYAWLLMLLLAPTALADTQINVVGLYKGKAVLIINSGKPQTLSEGQTSREGVKLMTANSQRAVFEVEGQRRELGMGQAATVTNSSHPRSSVTLYADSAGHYFSQGWINGVPLKFLVDTGATTVALNSGDARYAGIDYKKGRKIQIETAGGTMMGYRVVINTLKLGSLILHPIEAVVLEGGSPAVVLLGMSALNRMEMKREGIALTLTKKY